jgi:hypothetical protein
METAPCRAPCHARAACSAAAANRATQCTRRCCPTLAAIGSRVSLCRMHAVRPLSQEPRAAAAQDQPALAALLMLLPIPPIDRCRPAAANSEPRAIFSPSRQWSACPHRPPEPTAVALVEPHLHQDVASLARLAVEAIHPLARRLAGEGGSSCLPGCFQLHPTPREKRGRGELKQGAWWDGSRAGSRQPDSGWCLPTPTASTPHAGCGNV